MHTHYKSEKPGNCPICSMKLVKLEKPSEASGQAESGMQGMPGMEMGAPAESQSAAATTPTTNTIFIAPQRQQLIGVQSVPVTIKPLVKEIRTVGRVTYDETKLTHIHTKVTGYVEEVFVDFVGKVVKKGEPLFTIYSPDLVATQEEYLLAVKSRNVLKDSSISWISSGSNDLLEATRRRLRLWDITDAEIQALEKEGKVKRALTIYSPVSGIVTERAAYHHGRYVNPEMDLYTIVDLSTVWVLAEIYEYELPYVKVGQSADIEFPYASNSHTLRGKITYFYPYLNPKTRTTQIRMEFPNPDLALRPDMFFNTKLRINLGEQLVVPEDAVLDTGTEQYVFVDKGDGYFEPRPVKLGAEAGGYYAIQSGLQAGERVVTAANFILDSESRLKGAFANMGKPTLPEAGEGPAATQKLSVEIREPKEAKVGKNTLRLTVKDAFGNPVEDAEVEVTLFMPQMGTMPPMSSKAVLKHQGRGQYVGAIDVPMAWTWQTTVIVKKGGKTLGTVETSLTAR
jgi:RND family efflux transporter MFP subunit